MKLKKKNEIVKELIEKYRLVEGSEEHILSLSWNELIKLYYKNNINVEKEQEPIKEVIYFDVKKAIEELKQRYTDKYLSLFSGNDLINLYNHYREIYWSEEIEERFLTEDYNKNGFSFLFLSNPVYFDNRDKLFILERKILRDKVLKFMELIRGKSQGTQDEINYMFLLHNRYYRTCDNPDCSSCIGRVYDQLKKIK